MTAADPETNTGGAGSPPEPAEPGAKPKRDKRAERLAEALRANLGRRKAARRAGLDDFTPPEDDGEAR